VEKTLREKPQAATHWSTRTMARVVGGSHTSVNRIWHAHGLKPHLTRGFKLSNDNGSSRRCRMSSASISARRTEP
jgi:hypothetical protein